MAVWLLYGLQKRTFIWLLLKDKKCYEQLFRVEVWKTCPENEKGVKEVAQKSCVLS